MRDGRQGDDDDDRQHSPWWKQEGGQEAKKRLPGELESGGGEGFLAPCQVVSS